MGMPESTVHHESERHTYGPVDVPRTIEQGEQLYVETFVRDGVTTMYFATRLTSSDVWGSPTRLPRTS